MANKCEQALQQNGHTVAMTGDGVNDVLALRQSDCSIAMAAGTDAARNVSQLVLLDSNFDAFCRFFDLLLCLDCGHIDIILPVGYAGLAGDIGNCTGVIAGRAPFHQKYSTFCLAVFSKNNLCDLFCFDFFVCSADATPIHRLLRPQSSLRYGHVAAMLV